jgi:tetratricopeptide (TPR) repeat protein
MEQIVPGEDPDNPDSDPIVEAVELYEGGLGGDAIDLLMDLLEADLRCLDAHAHLGNFAFSHSPKRALQHYEMGLRIGNSSLGPGFDNVLCWGAIDNRPFLRCLHGYGLCLWRLGRRDEAEKAFVRMLRLNPPDNQGARFILDEVRAGNKWKPEEDPYDL